MRTKTLISVQSEDRTHIKNFMECLSILGLQWKLPEEEQKPFMMIRSNEFTIEEAQHAVAVVKAAAQERMDTAFLPTGIQFYFGAEQERQFQESLYANGVRAMERADEFLADLLADLKTANRETIRRYSAPKGANKVERETASQ